MWLRRLRSKIRYWICRKIPDDWLSPQQKNLDLLEILDPLLFEKQTTVRKCAYEVSTLYRDLREYTEALQFFSDYIVNHHMVPTDTVRFVERRVSIEQLFIHKGSYLPTVASVVAFKKAAHRFTSSYFLIEHAQIEEDGYNARALIGLYYKTLELTRSLIEYTHHESS